MTKFIAALILSALMALTSLTPQQALAADGEAIAGLLIGALVLYGIADAIDDRNEREAKEKAREAHEAHRAREASRVAEAKRRERARKARFNLPSNCIRTHEKRSGEKRRVLGNRCLQNNFRHYADLPDRCFRRINTVRGTRAGWGMKCLRREGYSWS
ncbi:MAG: hypothetical protein AAGI10_03410 [Pseudomonadota bacterium]